MTTLCSWFSFFKIPHSLAYQDTTSPLPLQSICDFRVSVASSSSSRPLECSSFQSRPLSYSTNSSGAKWSTAIVSMIFYVLMTSKFVILAWMILGISRSVYLLYSCYLLLAPSKAGQAQLVQTWMQLLLSFSTFSRSLNGSTTHSATPARIYQGSRTWLIPHPHFLHSQSWSLNPKWHSKTPVISIPIPPPWSKLLSFFVLGNSDSKHHSLTLLNSEIIE